MLKFIDADVSISENHVQRVSVAAWEIPILQAIHQREEIKVIDEKLVDRPAPPPDEEFGRLAKRYGTTVTEDGGKGASYVSAVYGQFGASPTGALTKAIKDATVEVAPTSFDDLVGEQVSSVGG